MLSLKLKCWTSIDDMCSFSMIGREGTSGVFDIWGLASLALQVHDYRQVHMCWGIYIQSITELPFETVLPGVFHAREVWRPTWTSGSSNYF